MGEAVQCGGGRVAGQAFQRGFGASGESKGTFAAIAQRIVRLDRGDDFGQGIDIARFDDRTQALAGGMVGVLHRMDQGQRHLAFGKIIAQVLSLIHI